MTPGPTLGCHWLRVHGRAVLAQQDSSEQSRQPALVQAGCHPACCAWYLPAPRLLPRLCRVIPLSGKCRLCCSGSLAGGSPHPITSTSPCPKPPCCSPSTSSHSAKRDCSHQIGGTSCPCGWLHGVGRKTATEEAGRPLLWAGQTVGLGDTCTLGVMSELRVWDGGSGSISACAAPLCVAPLCHRQVGINLPHGTAILGAWRGRGEQPAPVCQVVFSIQSHFLLHLMTGLCKQHAQTLWFSMAAPCSQLSRQVQRWWHTGAAGPCHCFTGNLTRGAEDAHQWLQLPSSTGSQSGKLKWY